jgi:hypothetical protein
VANLHKTLLRHRTAAPGVLGTGNGDPVLAWCGQIEQADRVFHVPDDAQGLLTTSCQQRDWRITRKTRSATR